MNFRFLQRCILKNRYAQLIIYRAYSDLIVEAKQYFSGYAWWVIVPLLDMLIYYIVFGVFFQRKTPDYVPFLLTGILSWRWFNSSVMSAMNSIRSNTPLMNQVHVPKIIFPTVVLISDSFKFLITLFLLLIFLWSSGFHISISYVFLPALLLIHFLLNAAIAFVIAAIIPFYPDLSMFVTSTLRIMFFLSGIFYTVSDLGLNAQFYLNFNPMIHIIGSYRNILIYDQWPDFTPLCFVTLFSLAGVVVGYKIVKHFDYYYPKIS